MACTRSTITVGACVIVVVLATSTLTTAAGAGMAVPGNPITFKSRPLPPSLPLPLAVLPAFAVHPVAQDSHVLKRMRAADADAGSSQSRTRAAAVLMLTDAGNGQAKPGHGTCTFHNNSQLYVPSFQPVVQCAAGRGVRVW